MKTLSSYVSGDWKPGTGKTATLLNPATEEALAETSTQGIDCEQALVFARERGGPALRELSFAQRGAMLREMVEVLGSAREELIELAVANGGNTRGDAKFDIDGARMTLAHYADLGEELGDCHTLVDGDAVQVGRTARFAGQRMWSPRRGVAVHVNAFNFPAWGLAEKAACALLAGMPVLSKPATATALVTHRMVELFAQAQFLPDGALSLLCGSAGDLLEHLKPQDALAFTGSGSTASVLRKLAAVVDYSVPINVEADSLNAAVLGPDVSPGTETWHLFIRDVAREMTQKAGQKCTATRRVFVPTDRMADVEEALSEALAAVVVGDPTADKVRMGPLTNAAQRRDVQEGLARLSEVTDPVYGDRGDIEPVGAPGGKGFFLGPVLRKTSDPGACLAMHDREVFGPVATLGAYDGSPGQAAELIARGQGALVGCIYSDDRAYFGAIVPEVAAYHGRLYLGSDKMAAQSMGSGLVFSPLVHGGPGRAGGGSELGGVRGLRFYQQHTALQGDRAIIKAVLGQ